MTFTEIFREIESLPPEAQREVRDFVAFLKARYASARRPAKRTPLEKEPFVGLWKGRAEMRDSVRWVRTLRETEWERR
jgi:hypothetical protein